MTEPNLPLRHVAVRTCDAALDDLGDDKNLAVNSLVAGELHAAGLAKIWLMVYPAPVGVATNDECM